MSKQTENYIGSQQHWEDRVNDDYDYLKQMEKEMEKEMEKDVEKLMYNGLEKRNKIILTPKEKANELVTMHHNLIQDIGGELGQEILVTILAKQCALIAVDEILFVLEFNLDFKMERSIAYYLEVKQEIEKL
jgi:hypothetical protein